jgi:hypothetical protein
MISAMTTAIPRPSRALLAEFRKQVTAARTRGVDPELVRLVWELDQLPGAGLDDLNRVYREAIGAKPA